MAKTINNDIELDQSLNEIGDLQRRRGEIQKEINDQIALLQKQLVDRTADLTEQINDGADRVARYCVGHRDRLFPEKKSLKLVSGEIKFRKGDTSVASTLTEKFRSKLLADLKLDKAWATVQAKFAKFNLRLKLEINKDACLADQAAAKELGFKFKEANERIYIKPTNIESEIEREIVPEAA